MLRDVGYTSMRAPTLGKRDLYHVITAVSGRYTFIHYACACAHISFSRIMYTYFTYSPVQMCCSAFSTFPQLPFAPVFVPFDLRKLPNTFGMCLLCCVIVSVRVYGSSFISLCLFFVLQTMKINALGSVFLYQNHPIASASCILKEYIQPHLPNAHSN